MLDRTIKDIVRKHREELHKIPELGFEEFKTQEYLRHELEKLGYQLETVAKTGLVAYKKGVTDEVIAFRSDIDALPVSEKTGLPFSSVYEGRMHACGHDGHMSILLGFAAYLTDKLLKKSVLLIFQPAEEGPGGAKVIIDEGILKKYQVAKIFGLHIFPELPEGVIGLAETALMARVGEFDCEISGKSAHGALPDKGVDAIVAASHLVQSYQSIVSRSLNPLDSAVVTIGTIKGGEARNIIAGDVLIQGTIRALNEEVYQTVKKRITSLNHGIETMYGVKIKDNIRDMYPELINDYSLFQFMTKILNKNEWRKIQPLMIAEDFAYYLKEVPGYFFLLGSRNEEKGYVHPLHSCYFNFDSVVLDIGVETFIRIAKSLSIID